MMYSPETNFQNSYKQVVKLSKLENHLGDYSEEAMTSPSSKYLKLSPKPQLNSNYNHFE